MYCIYKVTNLSNGKLYIGKTNNLSRRKKDHLNHKENHLFGRALHKYGEENFKWEIIENKIRTLNESNEREKFWIKYYNSYFRSIDSNGYNMTRGGDGGSDWNLKKVASYNKDGNLIKTFNTITECTEFYGISGTTEVSTACKKESALCHEMMFRYIENDKIIYKIKPFERINPKCKEVCQLDLQGNYIKTFDSITIAAEKTSTRRTGILGVLRDEYKSSNDYIWCYKEYLSEYINKPIEEINSIKGVKILQFSLNNEYINSFNSCAEAARKNNLKNYKNIHKALGTETHISYGYKWFRSNDYQYDNTEVIRNII